MAGIHWATGAKSLAGPAGGPGSNVEKLARSLFTTYLLPFEVTSVLLVIAVVGAVVLARRPSKETEPEPPEAATRPGRPEVGRDTGPSAADEEPAAIGRGGGDQ
jgi:NADH-quinone oxidoreductase subunit J